LPESSGAKPRRQLQVHAHRPIQAGREGYTRGGSSGKRDSCLLHGTQNLRMKPLGEGGQG